jgi:hypothetical protein
VVLGGVLGKVIGGAVFMIVFAVVAGLNGAFSGYYRIYRWDRWTGWVAFVLDSTWAMIGTALAVAIHIGNIFWPGKEYRHDCSLRQNRHIYFGGLRLKGGFAFNQGNVISNADSGRGVVRPAFLKEHEELHIWQNRWFGPLFQLTYVLVGIVGSLVAAVYWLFHREERLASLVETTTYYDNPFEYWAYVNNRRWPHPEANPALAWPRPAERPDGADDARLADKAEGCVPPGEVG